MPKDGDAPKNLQKFEGIYVNPSQFGFDGQRARELAMLIGKAYSQFEQPNTWSIPKDYHLIKKLYHDSQENLFGFVAHKNTDVFIIIRGTKTIWEWYNNTVIQYTEYKSLKTNNIWGETTKGFYSIYSDLRNEINDAMQELKGGFNNNVFKVFVSGHSLGGALATLAIPDLLDQGIPPSMLTVYTFASPRCGDRVFAHKVSATGVKHWRIANTEDIVPALPGGTANIKSPEEKYKDNFIVKLYKKLKEDGMKTFEHTGTPVYFTIGTNSVEDNHNLDTIYMKGIGLPPL
jgi:hypothetical protein